jgi:hypothetical protein
MRKFLKTGGIIISVFIILIIAGLAYFNASYPKVSPPPDLTIELSDHLIARGNYLANHVALCTDCHAQRDFTKFAGPIKPGTLGAGGDVFDESMGLPGAIYSKNITPDWETGLGSWSDGEIMRAITMGVNKHNEALFPIMPYLNYNILTEYDLHSIIAYLRTLDPVKKEIPERRLNFPLNLIVKTIPLDTYNSSTPVSKENRVEYGKYLVTIASCNDCHTPAVKGEPIAGMEFAGGTEFSDAKRIIRSLNITPDYETGIGKLTRGEFIEKFKSHSPDVMPEVDVPDDEYNTVMPWRMYAGMTEDDLGAIYDYLRTVTPVKNKVERFSLK